MSRYRPLILPAVLTLAALGVLIGLGNWQLDRLAWKEALIERIEARANGEAVSMALAKEAWEGERDVEYYRVLLIGRFLHAYERHLYGIVDGNAGWRVITPLETSGGDIILVDRGIVPEPLKDAAKRGEGQIAGTVELVGIARAPGAPSAFTPDNQPAANRWFWRDVDGMIASLPEELRTRVLPFMAEAEKMDVPGGWPRGGATYLDLPNRHLEYALTWFGLALALLGVFGVYARRKLYEPRQQGSDSGGSV
ncbi:MAG: SURF1 family protein [Rhodomicrobiaceae bacterium]